MMERHRDDRRVVIPECIPPCHSRMYLSGIQGIQKGMDPPVKPGDDSKVVIPAKAGIQSIYKSWIPHQVRNDKKNGFPVELGMTKRDKGMIFHSVIPKCIPPCHSRMYLSGIQGIQKEWIPRSSRGMTVKLSCRA
jgi:hypothetical protein